LYIERNCTILMIFLLRFFLCFAHFLCRCTVAF
jgi:hypothetical protein